MAKDKGLSPEQFIKIYQSSGSQEEVVAKIKELGIELTVNAVSSRAVYYRKKGVPLKRFGGGGARPYDWHRLKKLAESIGETENEKDHLG